MRGKLSLQPLIQSQIGQYPTSFILFIVKWIRFPYLLGIKWENPSPSLIHTTMRAGGSGGSFDATLVIYKMENVETKPRVDCNLTWTRQVNPAGGEHAYSRIDKIQRKKFQMEFIMFRATKLAAKLFRAHEHNNGNGKREIGGGCVYVWHYASRYTSHFL